MCWWVINGRWLMVDGWWLMVDGWCMVSIRILRPSSERWGNLMADLVCVANNGILELWLIAVELVNMIPLGEMSKWIHIIDIDSTFFFSSSCFNVGYWLLVGLVVFFWITASTIAEYAWSAFKMGIIMDMIVSDEYQIITLVAEFNSVSIRFQFVSIRFIDTMIVTSAGCCDCGDDQVLTVIIALNFFPSFFFVHPSVNPSITHPLTTHCLTRLGIPKGFANFTALLRKKTHWIKWPDQFLWP